jgi:hypothetical protein
MNRTKLTIAIVLVLLAAAPAWPLELEAAPAKSAPAAAAGGDPYTGHIFGLGLVGGVPIGVSGKVFVAPDHAIAVTAGWDFIYGGFSGIIDYLYHFHDVINNDTVMFRPYVGAGFDLADRWDPWETHRQNRNRQTDYTFGLAPRATGGATVMFRKFRLEVFLETSPGGWVYPHGEFYFGAMAGARYFF